MDTQYFIPIISFVAGIIGVFLTHHLTQKRKIHDELINFRLKAYSDFMSSAALLACARRAGDTKDEIKLLGQLNDAKVRICIAATPKVLQHLENFWLHGGTLEKELEILEFTRLCNAIRVEINPKHTKTTNNKLSAIIFRLNPSSFSFAAQSKT